MKEERKMAYKVRNVAPARQGKGRPRPATAGPDLNKEPC